MTLIDVQQWRFTYHDFWKVPCECDHPRDNHDHDGTGECSQCGWDKCHAYTPLEICRCGHPRYHHFDDEYGCQDCRFTGCLEFVLQEPTDKPTNGHAAMTHLRGWEKQVAKLLEVKPLQVKCRCGHVDDAHGKGPPMESTGCKICVCQGFRTWT